MIYPPIPRPMMKQADFLQAAMAAKGKFLPWFARSIHGTTGWLPGMARRSAAEQTEILKRIGAGQHGAVKGLQEAEAALAKVRGTPAEARALKALNRAKAELEWATTTGGTIPGMAQAFVREPGKVVSQSWKSMSPVHKGLFGYFGYTGARDVTRTPESEYGRPGSPYKSRLHHFGSELGSNLTWLAGAPLGLVPSIAGFVGGGAVGGLPGRLMARPPAPLPPEYSEYPEYQGQG